MKQPIKPEDIRKGDLIRVEWAGSETAEEWRWDGVRIPYRGDRVRYYLLDRPKLKVDLPTEPTVGWVEWADRDGEGGKFFGRWNGTDRATEIAEQGGWTVTRGIITAFTPAVAVPKAALDKLREVFDTAPDTHKAPRRTLHYSHAIAHFLKAVDEANGADR